MDYKLDKEAFVANNTGTSVFNVLLISSVGWTSYYLYSTLSLISSTPTRPLTPTLCFLTTIIPLFLVQTIFSSFPGIFNLVLSALGILVWVWGKRKEGDRVDLGRVGVGREDEVGTGAGDEGGSVGSSATNEDSKPDTLAEIDHFIRLRKPQDTSHSQQGSLNILTPPLTRSNSEEWRISIDSPHTSSFPPTSQSTSQLSHSTKKPQKHPPTQPQRFPPQNHLTTYRAHMLVMTTIAILAVDFKIFPRVFGKCEDFGVGLMDVGVGSFVFSLGITSAFPFIVQATSKPSGVDTLDSHSGKRPEDTNTTVPSASTKPTLLQTLIKGVRKSLPIWLLGIARVIMVKKVDYPEHMTEYGVHWNFFFTLGTMPLVGTILGAVRETVHARVGWKIRFRDLGLGVLFLHWTGLQLGFQEWVMGPDRDGLVALNKEGIISLAGYIAIYLLGIDLGHYVLPPDPYQAFPERALVKEEEDAVPDYNSDGSALGREERRKGELGMILVGYSFVWWGLLAVMWACGDQVSRRLANTSYVIWTAAFNTTFLAGYLFIELIVFGADNKRKRQVVPPLLIAYNKNGLALFLAANLLTGLINVSMKTMYASDTTAMVVITGYLGILSVLAWLLRHRRFMI